MPDDELDPRTTCDWCGHPRAYHHGEDFTPACMHLYAHPDSCTCAAFQDPS